MKIPKIIHFIWAGGDNIMPAKSIQVVTLWHQANPTFNIFLWVDPISASSPAINERNREDYHRLLGDLSGKIHFKDIEGTSNSNGETVRVADDYIRYEIERLRPNYGSSSDLLRYKILYEFGGAYFDSDVKPGKLSLENSSLFDVEQKEHNLYVDSNSQNTHMVGNDSLICTPQNPILQRILMTAVGHYNLQVKDLDSTSSLYRSNLLLARLNSPPAVTYQYDDLSYICEVTPFKTGPFCIRKNVEAEEGELKEVADDNMSLISSMDNLTFATKNNRDWVDKPLLDLNLDETIKKINSTIVFEAKELNMLRLDDHVNNLIKITQCDKDFAAKTIIGLLDGLSLDKCSSIQLTYCHETTIRFCEANNLLDKTYLFPLVKSCHETTGDIGYYESAISSVMANKQYGVLLNILNKAPTEKSEIIQCLLDINHATLKFLANALKYCENLMGTISANDRGTKGQQSVIADYLQCLLENIANAKSGLQKFHVPLRNSCAAEEEQKDSAEITKFSNELEERKVEVDAFFINHRLKRPSTESHEAVAENKNDEERKHGEVQGANKDNNEDDGCHCRIV